ncbi:MAG: helix-turn-helix domain-containing protein [Gemmatimonadota bacterium]
MLPIELRTPADIVRMVAERVRALRLERGWSQQELAQRSGIAFETYKRFERSGQISLERLAKIATVLDALRGFDELFRPAVARGLEDLERRTAKPARKRASGRRAKS